MLQTDYRLEALDFLLDRDCLMERYYPLIEYKNCLLSGLVLLGCKTKSDAEKRTDDDFIKIGLNDANTITLFRRFLTLYDPKPQKFREIAKLCPDPAMQAAFRELYHLPGVKYVRAELYWRSGFQCLRDLAVADTDAVLEKTAQTISRERLSCIVPLPKEVRTHIAVARAFTLE